MINHGGNKYHPINEVLDACESCMATIIIIAEQMFTCMAPKYTFQKDPLHAASNCMCGHAADAHAVYADHDFC